MFGEDKVCVLYILVLFGLYVYVGHQKLESLTNNHYTILPPVTCIPYEFEEYHDTKLYHYFPVSNHEKSKTNL